MSNRKLKGVKGFTFNEVLIAMNLVAIAVVGYGLSSTSVLREQTRSDHLTSAIHLAHDKMEQLQAAASLVNQNLCPDGGDRGISATGAAGGVFDRCWTIADSSLGSHLKEVHVQVSWRDFDKRQLRLSTLVFVGK